MQTGEYEVVVVGGGQAGLAVGYYLRRAGVDFTIVDAGAELGQVWRDRWDSLRLFTPARYAGLPGMPFPAPPDTYPGKDDVGAYLGAYAQRFALPVWLGARVTELARTDDGYDLTLQCGQQGGQRLIARQVVVATGPYSVPYVPGVAAGLAADVTQVHTSEYRGPDQIGPGRVVVVGGGNSGFQVAAELVDSGRTVDLSESHRNRCVPQRPLGRDLFWWLDRLGLIRATADSRLGARLKARNVPVIGSSRKDLRRRGVTLRPRTTSAFGRAVSFADGSTIQADTVIWATGYRVDDTWIKAPRRPRRPRRTRTAHPAQGNHPHPRPVHDRPELAAHSGIRAARVRPRRRRVARRAPHQQVPRLTVTSSR